MQKEKIKEEKIVEKPVEKKEKKAEKKVEKKAPWLVLDEHNVLIGDFENQQDALDLQKRFPNSKVLYTF